MDQNKTVLIIGAGPAGLTAAYELLKTTDFKPVVLEREAFVGGIARTAEHNGNRIDIGGHRFFSKSEEVMALWREIMPLQGAPALDDRLLGREVPLEAGGPDPEREERVMLRRERVSRILYLHKFFDYPISLKPQTILNMGLARTFRAGVGYMVSACHKRQENNLEDFMINRFGVSLYRMFFRNYTEKVWGRPPKEIGADWGAQRIKGLSLRKTLADGLRRLTGKKGGEVETSLIESFYYPKRGPGQLWETMADEITRLGGTIVFGARADGFEFDENGAISAVLWTEGGERRSAHPAQVISSMPVCELISAMGEHVADPEVKRIAAGLPYRDFITVGLLVPRLRIQNTTSRATLGNIVPDCWIYVQEDEVKMGRIQVFNNWSPYMVADPEHTVWVGLEYFCNEGDALWSMSKEDFIRMAEGEMARIGLISAGDVLDSVCIKVEKAYPAYFDTYAEFDTLRGYLDTTPNLFCVGRNGQHRYNNMDHSMLTAMEAVKAIREGSGSHRAVWEVNTEQEYHEEKEEEQ